MAKKRKSTRSKAKAKATPQHSLPAGFWAQVGAVFLVAVSFLFVVSWFGAGGPVLEWLRTATQNTIGYAMYVLPLLFVYLAVGVFRAENNRLPFVVKFATALLIVWCAGLSGLLQNSKVPTGGFIGDTVSSGMLALVNSGVAAFIYVLFILVTLLQSINSFLLIFFHNFQFCLHANHQPIIFTYLNPSIRLKETKPTSYNSLHLKLTLLRSIFSMTKLKFFAPYCFS